MSARRVFLGGAALWLAACAGVLPHLDKPEVTVAGLRLAGGTLLAPRFMLTLRVSNPNDLEIPVESLAFTVDLNDAPFAEGVSTQALRLPARGAALLEIAVSARLASLLREFKADAPPAYRLKGQLVTGRYGRFDFDRKGIVGK